MNKYKSLLRFLAAVLILSLLGTIPPSIVLAAEGISVSEDLPEPVSWTDPNDPDNPYPYGLPVDTVFPEEIFAPDNSGISIFAQGKIPDEMWDNSILRALQYTGYDVKWLKDNNKLYDASYIASSLKTNRPNTLSDIGYYSSGACPNGDETVKDTSTVTGKAPDIGYFESNGMVCASFVTYYLCNYLPNIEGVDTSAIYTKLKQEGKDPNYSNVYYLTTVTLWKKVLDHFSGISGSGVTRYTDKKTAYQNLVPGDVIVFASEGTLVHIGIYAGEYDLYSGGTSRGIYHFMVHVGNSRGPEINTVEYMATAGSKASEPIAWYHLDINNPKPKTGWLEVNKSDEGGKALAGAVFTAIHQQTGKSYSIGPTNSSGYAKSAELPLGTYQVTETTFPTGYTASGQTSWKVTLTEDTPNQTISISAVNAQMKWRITVRKQDRKTGTAQANATLDGAVYGIYRNGTLLKQYTVKNGVFTTDSYPCGTGYTLKEITAPTGYRLDPTVYDLSRYSTVENCSGVLTTSQITVLEDVILGSFKIKKNTYDPVSKKRAPEADARFRCYLKSTGTFDACPAGLKCTLTTGADGIAISPELPYGTYVLEQTAGTAGTELMSPREIVIAEHGKVYTYEIDNHWWTGSVEIVKTESGTEIPLDAKFSLMDSDGNHLESDWTGEDGKLTFLTRLVYGRTYYVQEIEAPAGYQLNATRYPLKIESKDQKITLKVENSPQEGSIGVKKVNVTGEPLSGIRFLLEYSLNSYSWQPVRSRTENNMEAGTCSSPGLTQGILETDATGMAIFTGLRINSQENKVVYRLTEVSSESGMTLMAKPVFEGELPYNDSLDITITAVNSDDFELPHTGSCGIIAAPLAGGLILYLLAAAFIHTHRKYRKEG